MTNPTQPTPPRTTEQPGAVKRLFISFSGGKTSAYMTDRLLREEAANWDEIIVGFANTGEEHELTLEYVNNCDNHYGFGVKWLEAVHSPIKGEGTRHRLVNYFDASRKGEPFVTMSAKYGIPNTQFPHCTRELKLNPIKSYLRSRGWESGTYRTAIGIRADELDRISPVTMAQGGFYPLIEWQIDKQDVLDWELKQPVRLGIPEHMGNCVWCWKKSNRKLATVALEQPGAFRLPIILERDYRDHGPGFGDRRLFRGRRTTNDIFDLAKDPAFEPFVDGFAFKNEDMDQGASCGESCEIGVDGAHDEGIA